MWGGRPLNEMSGFPVLSPRVWWALQFALAKFKCETHAPGAWNTRARILSGFLPFPVCCCYLFIHSSLNHSVNNGLPLWLSW